MKTENGTTFSLNSLKWIVPSLGAIALFGWNLAIDRGDDEIQRVTDSHIVAIERCVNRCETAKDHIKFVYDSLIEDYQTDISELRNILFQSILENAVNNLIR